jgi:hypothetical protein
MLQSGNPKPYQLILPILKHAVFDDADILFPSNKPGRAMLTKAACDRLTDERCSGFDEDAMRQCHSETFEFVDLDSRFPDPENLCDDELATFVILREVMRGCLAFDPACRLSSHNALEKLTGRIHRYESMPDQALEDIRSVELAVQFIDEGSLEKRRRFIKHFLSDGQPTPISKLLDPIPNNLEIPQ